MYEDYEKTQLKLDAILLELSNIKKEHKKEIKKITKEFKNEIPSLNDTIIDLNKKLDEANKLIEKLKNDNDRLKNQNNKISYNSIKPSSTDITKPKNLELTFIISESSQIEKLVPKLDIKEVIYQKRKSKN